MRLHHLALAAAALLGAACAPLELTAQAGYTEMAIQGDIALNQTAGGGTASLAQDIETSFGLGDPQGSPYGRAQLDCGVPVLAVSAFTFDEQGAGRLSANYGNIPAGSDVVSDLSFVNAKASLAFEIDLGPLSLSPGIAVDYFDLQLTVRDAVGVVTENVDLSSPVPLLFLRGEVELGAAALMAEVGYLQVSQIDEVDGTFWDAEAMVEVRPDSRFRWFAGYRLIDLDVAGTVDNDDFAADLRVSGWFVGGGFRF